MKLLLGFFLLSAPASTEDLESQISALKKSREETMKEAVMAGHTADEVLQKDWDVYRQHVQKEMELEQKVQQLDKEIDKLETQRNSQKEIKVR